MTDGVLVNNVRYNFYNSNKLKHVLRKKKKKKCSSSLDFRNNHDCTLYFTLKRPVYCKALVVYALNGAKFNLIHSSNGIKISLGRGGP
jgi:hypothetical protein